MVLISIFPEEVRGLLRTVDHSRSKAYAKAITSCLAVAYHDNMDLKEEAITHEILQGKVVLGNAKVHVKYNNKNLPSLLTTGNQRP